MPENHSTEHQEEIFWVGKSFAARVSYPDNGSLEVCRTNSSMNHLGLTQQWEKDC